MSEEEILERLEDLQKQIDRLWEAVTLLQS
jgi:hypothetical protein